MPSPVPRNTDADGLFLLCFPAEHSSVCPARSDFLVASLQSLGKRLAFTLRTAGGLATERGAGEGRPCCPLVLYPPEIRHAGRVPAKLRLKVE